MYTEDKKRIVRQYDVIEKNKKAILAKMIGQSLVLAILTLFCGGAGTGIMIAAFTETNGFLVLILLLFFGGLSFWAIPAVVAAFIRPDWIPCIAMLRGKYVFEIDHAEFSTPKTYHIKHSVFTVYVTQFEKYGKAELGEPPSMRQEFYVLAVLTKKPRIIAVYDTDKYEITQR